MKKKVLVGLSGGADSALTARLLMEEGYQVYGTFLRFFDHSDPAPAERVAAELGIPFSVVDGRRAFRRSVILPFIESYRRGETPNPCVECNRKMKIRCLLREADRLGIEWVATGHYARISRENGRYALLPAADCGKDQSYFLWKLTQKQLSRLLFPLADRKKENVLESAKDLVPREQKESMEICFIPHGDVARFLEENGGATVPGDFVDRDGKVLGRHRGIHCYTVGQRKGLGIALGDRRYVTEIRGEENRVVLGDREDLFTDRLSLKEIHWVSESGKHLPKGELQFRGRHRASLTPCRVIRRGKGAEVVFSAPQKRISPGQSACFYREGRLLFGGKICREAPENTGKTEKK